MGKRTFAMAADPDFYADHYEFQVPTFIVTNEIPIRHPRHNDRLSFTFVTDGLEGAVARAKAVAGGKNVTVVGGASVFQQCLNAGIADELHIDIMPVILGQGLRLFEHLDEQAIRLEKLEVKETRIRTQLRFRVVAAPEKISKTKG